MPSRWDELLAEARAVIPTIVRPFWWADRSIPTTVVPVPGQFALRDVVDDVYPFVLVPTWVGVANRYVQMTTMPTMTPIPTYVVAALRTYSVALQPTTDGRVIPGSPIVATWTITTSSAVGPFAGRTLCPRCAIHVPEPRHTLDGNALALPPSVWCAGGGHDGTGPWL